MRRVAVIGGNGFLGTNVVATFRRREYLVEPGSRRTGIDARDETQLRSFLEEFRPDVLVNCAAHVGGIAYNAQCPVLIYEDNLMIGFHLIRAAFECGVNKFVNIMPNCTYPGEMDMYTETKWWAGPMHPTVLTYGMPRKSLWVHAWAYKEEHGFPSIHLVLPNLYGPGDHFDPVRSHALGALICKVIDAKHRHLKEVEIWGTGEPVREWMYVDDAAEGIEVATELYDRMEILNIGSGQGCSIRELAECIRELAGWEGKFVYNPQRPDGAPRKILDVQKMHSVLKWSPRTSLREGISRTIRWYEEHRVDV